MAEGWTPVEESAGPEESPTAGWTPVEEAQAQPSDPRASFMAGVKDFPSALFTMGSTPSYEDFVKRTGGDMYRAMGLVTAAAAAGFGANKFAASRAASRAAAPSTSAPPPSAPSMGRYSVSSTNPQADAFYSEGAPAAPAAPPASTFAQKAGSVLGKAEPITRGISFWVPGMGRLHPAVEYLRTLADMAAKRGWAEGGEVLNRVPNRAAILESLRR